MKASTTRPAIALTLAFGIVGSLAPAGLPVPDYRPRLVDRIFVLEAVPPRGTVVFFR